MTKAQLIAYINAWIIDNNNKEITAAIMRDVLDKIVQFIDDNVGEVQDLIEGETVIGAINLLFQMFEDLDVVHPVNKFSGSDNPNNVPPSGYNVGDLYVRNGNQLYQYNGNTWVRIVDSADLPSSSLEVYSESGTLAGGDAEAKIGDLDLMTQNGSGIIYSQNFFGSGNSNVIIKNDNVGIFSNTLSLVSDIYVLESVNYIGDLGKGLSLSTEDNFLRLTDKTNAPNNKSLRLDYSQAIDASNTYTQSFQPKSGTIALENEEYTVSTLPSTPTRGEKAFITDATSPTYLGVAVGGGSVFCEVMYNGTDWVTI